MYHFYMYVAPAQRPQHVQERHSPREERPTMAQEQAPVVWGDEVDDDLIVSRESLDATTQRATPRAQPSQRIGWQRALSLRQRVVRGGMISLLVVLALFLLLGGPSATVGAIHRAGAALNARLHPPKPQATLADQGYKTIKSPPGGYNLPEMSIAPITGQADAAWTCWATLFSQPGKPNVWTAHAFYTASGGARWSTLALPTTIAQTCTVIADGESSNAALILLGQGLAPDGSCIAPYLYLTTDTGSSWMRVPWPLGPSDAACDVTAALRGGAIYLWSRTPLVRGTNPFVPPTGRLLISRDAGHTWTPADAGLDDSAGLAIVGFRSGGHILATIADVRVSGSASTLMASDDYGATWRNLGDPPGAFPQVFVSSDNGVTDHGGWGRLYEIAETETKGVPTVPPQGYLATAYVGQSWTPVPLPPLPDGAVAAAQSNQPLILGVGPVGALEAARGAIEAPNAQLSPARRMWVWNPSQSAWLLDPQTLPGNVQMYGAAWRAGDQIVWMTTLQLGVPPILQIYTKLYPADILGRNQRTPTTQR